MISQLRYILYTYLRTIKRFKKFQSNILTYFTYFQNNVAGGTVQLSRIPPSFEFLKLEKSARMDLCTSSQFEYIHTDTRSRR